MALTPIDPTLEMGHNTSAYSAYQASGFAANFTGTSYVSTSTTVSVNSAQMDDSMNPITPAHVSASSVKALVPNYTGKWFAHLTPWFGSSSHVSIGVNNNSVGWVNAMLADISARGFDGVIIDWYGQGRFEDSVTLIIQQQMQSYPNLTFSIMVDQGGYGDTAGLQTELAYIQGQYLNDPRYQHQGGLPVVFFFGGHSGVDYATSKASIQPTFWIFEGPGSASNAYVDGTFGWPSPFTGGVNASDPYNLAANNSYLSQVAGGKPAVPHVSPGFNGTLTKSIAWSLGKYLPRDSGKCWLETCANLNSHLVPNIIGIQVATWNDWEEGSQIETSIQNDIFITASLSGTNFQWSVSGGTGDETTLAGYRVIAASGAGAWLISTVATGQPQSIDLSTVGLQDGTTYSVYVVAVGVGSFRNQISNSVSYTHTVPPEPPQPPPTVVIYAWIQFAAARQQLANRLADPGNLFWTDVENGLYLIEALRVWNALTEVWNEDFTFTQTVAAKWYNLAKMAGSPRIRTVTDSDLYTLMQYHLLEPPSGGTWTGTSQFTMAMLRGALQRRADEIIQFSSSNLTQLAPIDMTPLVRTVPLPDTVLEPRRTRYLPAPDYGYTLARDDYWAWDRFVPYHQQTPGTPVSWGLIQGPPLTVAVDFPPDLPAQLDIIALMSGPTFAPPASTVMAIPDDWTWVAKWGALADLLGQESETTDVPRAQFCQQRYMDGLKAIVASNWLVFGRINGQVVDTPALAEMDHYSPDWEIDQGAWPSIVVAGMDFLAPCPVMTWPTDLQGVLLRVVRNAPIPVADDDYVQVSRDTFDAILNYAQAIAMFKQGGAEFAAGTRLLEQFALAAMETNSRLANMGLFPDVMRSQGKRQDVVVERIT